MVRVPITETTRLNVFWLAVRKKLAQIRVPIQIKEKQTRLLAVDMCSRDC